MEMFRIINNSNCNRLNVKEPKNNHFIVVHSDLYVFLIKNIRNFLNRSELMGIEKDIECP